MARTDLDVATLTQQLLRDPALSGSEEVIARRPMLDIYGHAFRFGGLERDPQNPDRIVSVRLVRVGAPERVHTLETDARHLPEALSEAIRQVASRVSAGAF